MKFKRSINFILIAAVICLAAALGVFFGEKGSADAETLFFAKDRITAISSGEEQVITEETWGAHTKIYYDCNYPYIRFIMSDKDSNWELTTDYFVPDGSYSIDIPQEGRIVVVAQALNNHKVVVASDTSTVYVDNTPPAEPDIDLVELDKYHINDFQVRYRIYSDNRSGVNYAASILSFIGEDQDSTIEPTSLAVLIPPQRRGLDNFTPWLKSNGTLVLHLIDNAGNSAEYSYSYIKHGVPETGAPQISLSTEEYAKSVTLTILWGAGYDDNPYAQKKYAIVTPSGTFPYDYKGSIEITTEGEVQILVYYYEDGAEKSVIQVVDNVDKTGPNLAVMQDTASIVCNTMAEDPVVFLIKATDRLSGIKRVYFKTGGELAKLDNGYFSAPIMDMYSFTVVAEDKAGNTAEYIYNNNYFDYETLKASNLKFLALDRADYTIEGWANVEKACNALSMLLLDELAQSSDIAQKAREIDSAITGTITVTNRIGDIPAGLDGGIVFRLDPAATDALKGENVTILFSGAHNADLSSKAGTQSGFSKRKVYAFSLALHGESAEVNLNGSMGFDMPLPESATDAKLYANVGGELVELVSEIKDGRVFASTSTLGDMYLVAERGDEGGFYIGAKFYSWKIIGITAGIIAGVCLAGGAVTYIIMKKRAR